MCVVSIQKDLLQSFTRAGQEVELVKEVAVSESGLCNIQYKSEQLLYLPRDPWPPHRLLSLLSVFSDTLMAVP